MPDIIRLLPDSIANQIAAGEVVQRPASVVKELLENSVDAGATRIELIINEAGKGVIQVVDNGNGMTETDARLSLERHATSKINNAEDLFKIKTMGFRGEALASIAAVAQLDIVTRKEDNEVGTRISVEASEVLSQEPHSTEKGTSIKVRNLFYNIPARRNFLKSNAVELRHIHDEFNHIALANPDREFLFFQDGEQIHHVLPGKLSQRIVGLFGKSYQEQLASCEGEMDFLQVHGYVGKPDNAKKTRGEQYLFVNNRFIKSHYINHAVTTAYEGLLPEKYFPFFALFITIDPKHIDINIHPTKTEIKFDDERTVYALVRSAVKKALGTHNILPSLDFKADINVMKQFDNSHQKLEKDYSQFRQINNPGEKKNTGNWEKLYDENYLRQSKGLDEIIEGESSNKSITFSSSMDEDSSGEDIEKKNSIQLNHEFILAPVKSGLMIINQKAAMETILYDTYQSYASGQKINGQQCLFPVTVQLSPADYSIVMEIKESLSDLGFNIEQFGKNTVAIQTIPADIVNENEKELLEGIVEQFKNSKNKLEISERENLLRSFAKKASGRKIKKLSREEMEELINKLFRCKNPNYTPTGKPTFKIIERKTIEGFFE